MMNKLKRNIFQCPYCMSKKGHFFCQLLSKINSRVVDYYRCKICGAIIQQPYPDDSVLQNYYESYFEIKQKLNSGYLTDSQYEILRHERDLTFCELKFEKTRIAEKVNVELGCANGLFLQYLQENNSQLTLGIDVSHSLLEEAEKRIVSATLVSDIAMFETLPGEGIKLLCASSLAVLPENFADNLYLFHLMEHVKSPDLLMEQAYRVLKQDGMLLLEVPVSGVVASFFHQKWRFFMPDEHLNIPSVYSIRQLAKRYGFHICSITRFGSGFTTGSVPLFLKRNADRMAKKLKFGDRAAFLLQKA